MKNIEKWFSYEVLDPPKPKERTAEELKALYIKIMGKEPPTAKEMEQREKEFDRKCKLAYNL